MNEIQIGLKKKSLDFIGSCVDELFLSLPKILKLFKPKRNIERATYEKQIDFYFDNGFVDQPQTFFTLPEEIPEYTTITRKPYADGTYEVIGFPSTYETKNPLIKEKYNSYKANKTGHLIRWTHGDSGRKTVMCLHGYMLGDPAQAHRMFKIRKLYNLGLDVALYITPFHWKRAPASKAMRGIFMQPDDVVMTCECLGQAMHDVYASIHILEDLGAVETGLIGASLGGYTAALFSCLTNKHSFAAMMVPAINFSRPFGPDSIRMPFHVDDPLKEKINRIWELHSPLNFMPKISKERLLFVASRGDKLCLFENVLAICEKWDWPYYRFMTGGHWWIFNERARGRAWYNFLGEMGFL